ncbi:DUF493 family protein [Oleiagrimonas sp. C23AA]|uniref:DUF493 family protein n=1 Tax=Oleiagrimonas sp. C23AA TaxID=2719047 RepID=UPI00141EB737|nr:DUF493 family protein [Oleiagrimonas sp. C23AA]NII09662.1 DUF493 family protein [Oleiagrimonas sp. C23AA]
MRDVDDIQPQYEGQGFQFPGTFTIVAMGNAGASLDKRVPALLSDIGLGIVPETLELRASRTGKYVSVHVQFTCPTRDKYDAAHAVLRADPDIRYTL